jgi:hypothetical protein
MSNESCRERPATPVGTLVSKHAYRAALRIETTFARGGRARNKSHAQQKNVAESGVRAVIAQTNRGALDQCGT